MPINQVISDLPAAPQRTDSPSDFSTKADAHVASLPTLVTQLNTYADEANSTQTAINTSESNASASATAAAGSSSTAQNAAVTAQGLANNRGAWSNLTGALNVPASVVHDGFTWLLLNNLSDVTASEPGSTNDWQKVDNTERITHNVYLHFYRNS